MWCHRALLYSNRLLSVYTQPVAGTDRMVVLRIVFSADVEFLTSIVTTNGEARAYSLPFVPLSHFRFLLMPLNLLLFKGECRNIFLKDSSVRSSQSCSEK